MRSDKLAGGFLLLLLGIPIYCFFSHEFITYLGEVFMIIGVYEILSASLCDLDIVAWFARRLKRG